MKCLKCGVDIYEGVKKCPYCKTPTESGTEKFKDFDFKYTITSAEQIKKIKETAKNTVQKKEGIADRLLNKIKLERHTVRRQSKQKATNEDLKDVPRRLNQTEPARRAEEMAKSASQRAAEFMPEGMARYTVRDMNGDEIQRNVAEEETLNAYTRIKRDKEPAVRSRRSRDRRHKRTNIKAIATVAAAVLCVAALVIGVTAVFSAVSKKSETDLPYTYIKDNSMYMVYKGKTVLLTENVIAESYIRAVENDETAVSAERAAKLAGLVRVSSDGKRVYFFDEYDPETASGVFKVINNGKAKRIKEVSQAVHNSPIVSEDGNKALFLKAADKNGDMGVLCYLNVKSGDVYELATDIDHGTFTFAGDGEWAVFLQNLNRVELQGDMYAKNLKKLKAEKVKVDSDVCMLFGEMPSGKAYIYGKAYDKSDKSFDIYAINKKNRILRLGERTSQPPLMQKTKDKLFVYGIADDGAYNLYSVETDSGKKEKIANGVKSVLMLSKDEKTVIFDKVYADKLADYYAYTKGRQPQKIAGNVTVDYAAVGGKPQMAVSEDCTRILYISKYEDFKGGGTLHLCEYKNGRITADEIVAEDVRSVYRSEDGQFIVAKDYSPTRKVFDVYLLEGKELVLLKDEVSPEMFGVAKKGNNIFCITDYNVEGKFGTLKRIDLKGEAEDIADEVFGFELVQDNVLFFRNLNESDGSFDLGLKKAKKKNIIELDTEVDEILNY